MPKRTKLLDSYFEKMAGILKTKGRLLKALLKEKVREKRFEEEKIKRLFPSRYLKKSAK